MKAAITIDTKTMARGRFLHWSRYPVHLYGFPLLGLMLILLEISIEQSPAVGVVILGSGIYFVLRYWIIGLRSNRQLKSSPMYGKVMQWTFNEDGYQAMADGLEFKAAWETLHESMISPDGCLLYPQKNIYYWIPLTAFESEDAFKNLAGILRLKTKFHEK